MLTRYRSTPEYVTGTFTETEGKDISGCDVQVGLSSTKLPPTTWQAPDDLQRPTPSTARVSLLIDSDIPAGIYTLWIKVTDSPEVLVRPAKNALVKVL
jgi:hypothetical protein